MQQEFQQIFHAIFLEAYLVPLQSTMFQNSTMMLISSNFASKIAFFRYCSRFASWDGMERRIGLNQYAGMPAVFELERIDDSVPLPSIFTHICYWATAFSGKGVVITVLH